MALSQLAEAASLSLSSTSSVTTTTGDSSSVSDLIITDNSSITSFDVVPFNDRSIEIRDVRLANALDSLDEDIPQDVDDSIEDLIKRHTNPQPTALGQMAFLVDEDYLEYKNNLAAKRASEKKLPKSKGQRSIPK